MEVVNALSVVLAWSCSGRSFLAVCSFWIWYHDVNLTTCSYLVMSYSGCRIELVVYRTCHSVSFCISTFAFMNSSLASLHPLPLLFSRICTLIFYDTSMLTMLTS
jgi:hypothetical protein